MLHPSRENGAPVDPRCPPRFVRAVFQGCGKVNERFPRRVGAGLIGLTRDNPEAIAAGYRRGYRLRGANRARNRRRARRRSVTEHSADAGRILFLSSSLPLSGFAQFRFIEKPEPKSPPNADYSPRVRTGGEPPRKIHRFVFSDAILLFLRMLMMDQPGSNFVRRFERERRWIGLLDGKIFVDFLEFISMLGVVLYLHTRCSKLLIRL